MRDSAEHGNGFTATELKWAVDSRFRTAFFTVLIEAVATIRYVVEGADRLAETPVQRHSTGVPNWLRSKGGTLPVFITWS
jgi:hypothetical protein